MLVSAICSCALIKLQESDNETGMDTDTEKMKSQCKQHKLAPGEIHSENETRDEILCIIPIVINHNTHTHTHRLTL